MANNRLQICRTRGIHFDCVYLSLDGRDQAKEWVVRNQLGRRNLTPFARSELALLLEPIVAARAMENQKAGGNSSEVGRQNSGKPLCTATEIGTIAGVSRDTINRTKVVLQHADEATKQQLRAGELTLHQAYMGVRRRETEEKRESQRAANQEKVGECVDLQAIKGVFATIVVDPPWDYGGQDNFGRGLPEYATLSMEELRALPVRDLADDNAHLYLWATNSTFGRALELVEDWGFRYVTTVTWCKPRFGLGHYFRSSTEHVLFAVRGSLPFLRHDVGTWFAADRTTHSTKPKEFYDLVESCSPGPRLEMFARTKRPGWSSWGADVAQQGRALERDQELAG